MTRGDNVLKPIGIQITVSLLPGPVNQEHREHRKLIALKFYPLFLYRARYIYYEMFVSHFFSVLSHLSSIVLLYSFFFPFPSSILFCL